MKRLNSVINISILILVGGMIAMILSEEYKEYSD